MKINTKSPETLKMKEQRELSSKKPKNTKKELVIIERYGDKENTYKTVKQRKSKLKQELENKMAIIQWQEKSLNSKYRDKLKSKIWTK